MATGWFPSRRLSGVEGWWEEPPPRAVGGLGLGLASLQGERRFPREQGNGSLKGGRNSSLLAAFFENPNAANSLRRRLLSRWDSGPFGKLCFCRWESIMGIGPREAAKLRAQEARVAWETQSYALPSTLDGSPALISLHFSGATKTLPQPASLDLALVSPAPKSHPESHRWEPDR